MRESGVFKGKEGSLLDACLIVQVKVRTWIAVRKEFADITLNWRRIN